MVRAHGLAHNPTLTHAIQWWGWRLGIVGIGTFLYYLAFNTFAQHFRSKSTEVTKIADLFLSELNVAVQHDDEIERCVLHGIDVSDSRFLMRPTVKRALDFAERAHEGQKRKTGEPYIVHCIQTALIMENLMDPSLSDAKCEMAIICALLHDVLEDTTVSHEHLQEEFDVSIATAVLEISELSSMIQLLRRHRRRHVCSFAPPVSH